MLLSIVKCATNLFFPLLILCSFSSTVLISYLTTHKSWSALFPLIYWRVVSVHNSYLSFYFFSISPILISFTVFIMGVIEKIKDIEAEMARTQKNKATEYHLGLLKVWYSLQFAIVLFSSNQISVKMKRMICRRSWLNFVPNCWSQRGKEEEKEKDLMWWRVEMRELLWSEYTVYCIFFRFRICSCLLMPDENSI